MKIYSVHWTNGSNGQQDNIKWFTVKTEAKKFLSKVLKTMKTNSDIICIQDNPDKHVFKNIQELTHILSCYTCEEETLTQHGDCDLNDF